MLIQRHIFQTVLVTSLVAVFLFAGVLMVGNALRDMADLVASGRVSFWILLRYIGLLVPYVAAYALPLGILVATLLVLGRMSARHEITALRASGLSLWQIAAPVLFLALLGTSLSLVVNSVYAPIAKGAYRSLLTDIVRDDPIRFIQPGQPIDDFRGYVIYAPDGEGNELRDLWVWELDDEDRTIRLHRAQSGRFTFDEESQDLLLEVTGGFTEFRSERDPDFLQDVRPAIDFSETRFRLPLADLLGDGDRPQRLSFLSLAQLVRLETQVSSELATASPEEAPAIEARSLEIRLQMQEYLSSSFATLSLALLAIPLGIRVGRSETYANIALALLLAFSYYFVTFAIGWLNDRPALRPDLLLWVPNLILQAAGITMIIRAGKPKG